MYEPEPLCGYPSEIALEIALDSQHQIASKPFQIGYPEYLKPRIKVFQEELEFLENTLGRIPSWRDRVNFFTSQSRHTYEYAIEYIQLESFTIASSDILSSSHPNFTGKVDPDTLEPIYEVLEETQIDPADPLSQIEDRDEEASAMDIIFPLLTEDEKIVLDLFSGKTTGSSMQTTQISRTLGIDRHSIRGILGQAFRKCRGDSQLKNMAIGSGRILPN